MLVDELARQMKLSAHYVRALARSASHRYKEYTIPKRTGGRRTIHHPSRELKLLQSWIAENVFKHFPIHPSAYAYVVGRGIAENASVHRRKNYLLKVDFVEFFPSITARDVQAVLDLRAANLPMALTPEDRSFILSVVCRDGRLTIGAPSSPILSNAVMCEFDRQWTAWNDSVLYTRYADDLFFSTDTPNLLSALLADLRLDVAMRSSPRLRINEDKTVFTSRKRRRVVTGLVLTSTGEVSLGRKQKRFIRSLLHRYVLRALDDEQIDYLRGFIAYARSVDPEFVRALERKFGLFSVQAIQTRP